MIKKSHSGRKKDILQPQRMSAITVHWFASRFLPEAVHAHVYILEAHACSSQRHMAVLQQVAVKTSCVYVCVRACVRACVPAYVRSCVCAFIRSLVRSFVRASAPASGYRLYMRYDVYCPGVAYERVSYISLHRFPIRKLYSHRDECDTAANFYDSNMESLFKVFTNLGEDGNNRVFIDFEKIQANLFYKL